MNFLAFLVLIGVMGLGWGLLEAIQYKQSNPHAIQLSKLMKKADQLHRDIDRHYHRCDAKKQQLRETKDECAKVAERLKG